MYAKWRWKVQQTYGRFQIFCHFYFCFIALHTIHEIVSVFLLILLTPLALSSSTRYNDLSLESGWTNYGRKLTLKKRKKKFATDYIIYNAQEQIQQYTVARGSLVSFFPTEQIQLILIPTEGHFYIREKKRFVTDYIILIPKEDFYIRMI